MSDFIAQIRAVLDTSKVESQLNALKNQTIKLNVELSGDGAKLTRLFDSQMSSMTSSATKAGQDVGKSFNQGIISAKFNGFNKEAYIKNFKDIEERAKEIVEKYGVTKRAGTTVARQELTDYLSDFKKIENYSKKFEQGYYKAQQASMQSQLEKFNGSNSKSLESAKKFATEFKDIQSTLGKHFDGTKKLSQDELVSYFDKAQDAAKKFRNEMKVVASEAVKPFDSLEASIASNKTLTYLNNNTKAMKKYGQAFKELSDKQKLATNNEELKHYNAEYRNLVSTVQKEGLTGRSFGDELKRGFNQIGQFVGTYAIFQKGIQTLKQMLGAVLDVDTAMTNLYKVTDETSAKYNEFLNNAGKTAKEVGRSVSSYITQTSEWAKLGYSMDESANLSKISSIYANVGEVDDKTAVSDLVTVMKAYNVQYDDALTIVDKYNKLGNEFATSAKDLGEGMSNAASMLSLGGTDLNKALALLTGGAEITQSAGELGNALKIGQMRIQGMKGDLEALGEESDGLESVSKIQTHILNLTKGQVNIMNSLDSTKFRDYYDILEDVSAVWDDLQQTERADLLETMFGKNRGNQGAAIIQAFQSGQVQKAYEATLNAEGSAQKEQDRWLESLEAKFCLVA